MRRKPKQHRATETHNVIVEAAAQVLLTYGYAKATTNRIAERAGVSVGSLYQYFDSKDAVFLALLNRYIDELILAAQEIEFPENSSFETKLELLALAGRNARLEGPQILLILSQTSVGDFFEIIGRAKRSVAKFVAPIVAHEFEGQGPENLELRLQIAVDAVEGLFVTSAAGLSKELFAKEVAKLIAPYLTRPD